MRIHLHLLSPFSHRNHNSSRFGKFVQLNFTGKGIVCGGYITNYLLEKSRTVAHASGERSFHIFYQLCAGVNDSQRKRLFLEGKDTRSFRYTNHGLTKVPGINDAEDFVETTSAMNIIGIAEEDQDEVRTEKDSTRYFFINLHGTFHNMQVLQMLAGILHIGNILFDEDDKEASSIATTSLETLQNVATLLSIEPNALGDALTSKKIHPRGRTLVTPLNAEQAVHTADAFAKAIYEKMFGWLVTQVNASLCTKRYERFIGVLDIYGFENFSVNGFEQLFINYANEKLQHLFNNLIFELEEKEYRAERIDWDTSDFPDNSVDI